MKMYLGGMTSNLEWLPTWTSNLEWLPTFQANTVKWKCTLVEWLEGAFFKSKWPLQKLDCFVWENWNMYYKLNLADLDVLSFLVWVMSSCGLQILIGLVIFKIPVWSDCLLRSLHFRQPASESFPSPPPPSALVHFKKDGFGKWEIWFESPWRHWPPEYGQNLSV